MEEDFYGEVGCCLTCENAEEDCLCYQCKCRRCIHYESTGDNGYCTLTIPPKGEVAILVDHGEDSVKVKIHPYLEAETFRKVVEVLKSFSFRYNPTEKTWLLEMGSEEAMRNMRVAMEELDVKVTVIEVAKKRRLDDYLNF